MLYNGYTKQKEYLKMDIKEFYGFNDKNEKPLDRLVTNGGFTGIFRTIGCIGDSLSSGEFESFDEIKGKDYHDMFEYSWGQYIAREAGTKVFNFSRGGMSAKEFIENFGGHIGFYDYNKACQAYIIALGVNDISQVLDGQYEFGSASDFNFKHPEESKKTFIGYYGRIINDIKKIQPKARVFLVSIPSDTYMTDERRIQAQTLTKELYKFCEMFDYTYVIDLEKYAPLYDDDFKRMFFLGGHLNPMGYMLTAKMVMSYIDYIIRHKPDDFSQVGFIGTPYHNANHKW